MAGAALLNGVIFIVAAGAGLRAMEPLGRSLPLHRWVAIGNELWLPLALANILTFAAAGALVSLWSRHWLAVAAPAMFAFLAVLALLMMSVYLVDGGDPEIMIMWRHILPDLRGVSIGIAVSAAAVASYRAASNYGYRARAKA